MTLTENWDIDYMRASIGSIEHSHIKPNVNRTAQRNIKPDNEIISHYLEGLATVRHKLKHSTRNISLLNSMRNPVI